MGYWGPNLVRNFVQSNQVRQLICVICIKKTGSHKELYPSVEVLSDYRIFFSMSDLDGVAIATPVKTHYPIAKEFLDQGKHVFVESP